MIRILLVLSGVVGAGCGKSPSPPNAENAAPASPADAGSPRATPPVVILRKTKKGTVLSVPVQLGNVAGAGDKDKAAEPKARIKAEFPAKPAEGIRA